MNDLLLFHSIHSSFKCTMAYMNGAEKLRKEKLDEKDKRIRALFIKMGFMSVSVCVWIDKTSTTVFRCNSIPFTDVRVSSTYLSIIGILFQYMHTDLTSIQIIIIITIKNNDSKLMNIKRFTCFIHLPFFFFFYFISLCIWLIWCFFFFFTPIIYYQLTLHCLHLFFLLFLCASDCFLWEWFICALMVSYSFIYW